jgi:AraC-like DNA-binding protein
MRFIDHIFVARPSRDPSPGLPFGVPKAGYYEVEPPFESFRKTLDRVQLFWCASGSGILMVNGQPRCLKSGQVAVGFPGMLHDYHADQGRWGLYWFTLDGPLAGANVAAYGLESAIYDVGPPPTELFKELMSRISEPTRQSELQAGSLAYAILAHVAGAYRQHADDRVDAALDLLHRHWNDPGLNLKTVAAQLAIGYTSLSSRFRASMGVTPSAYLQRLRVQNALSQLKLSRHSVKEIAFRCGYADPNYFARVIRRITGQPPQALRKSQPSP